MFHLALSVVLAVANADDAPANLVNARVQTHSAAAGLPAVFRPLARAAGPAWIGYAAPVNGTHQMCCYRSTEDIGKARPGCNIENEGAYSIHGASDAHAFAAATDFIVLFRVEGGRADRIRSLSRGCGIDVGGLPFHWITGVQPAESLALLESLVGTDAETSIAAIAMHTGAEADAVLARMVAASQPVGIRKQAAFWMGNSRGQRGYETLKRLASDSSPELREHVTFALSQSDVPEAVDTMIAIARGDDDAEVRGQALFWLGQKAGRKATAAITRAVAEDPETAVKKKAVFALSQLPKDEGVPLLIDLARKNTNAAVRKQAMFWLGQSKDARALAFFEEILAVRETRQ